MEQLCINCDFFQPDDPEQNQAGWCRRHPPRGIDDKTNTGAATDIWPPVEDAKIENCGEFKPTTTTG